ncbi:HEPN domain-containing protein [Mesorhizobium sp. M7A.F.Ca.MR.245.00.0.0]|uniref:HEPN domain-containing protein n=1 Tax=Mesorhizobium sp. M7A.F.Ca.MR.245.00.0.0 TaxID=2496778 RepID=UPI000FCBD22A|nr:HEPN domain-containing protein [Mesorhizobium sp. M7A.F.Ca.MR.245.00.0.0]RUV20724.1 hypothetical protein EOB80_14740 [Mesorhizobium sp. M7A.F.Ca.MR.245.00.0.0]RUV45260.1 hypothetical protein EOB77_32175 [Mesorhizobium sp. M7A.F.Ca.MR.228.00.0.0]
MVGVVAGADSKTITIFGHGIAVPKRFELSTGIWLRPSLSKLDVSAAANGSTRFSDYAAALQGDEIASFEMVVEEAAGGRELVVKGWNALWLFHLLSIACSSPCLSLYSVCDGEEPKYSAASRTPFVRPVSEIHVATLQQLRWAKEHLESFDILTKVPEFESAIKCFANAHYLPDHDIRIMLLWAGIEGLLSVDAELSRRLALYAAILMDGTPEQKAAYFGEVKKAYAIRSQAVHGSKAKPDKLAAGYLVASRILAGLLRRCVEIRRVPSPAELDRLAVGASIT